MPAIPRSYPPAPKPAAKIARARCFGQNTGQLPVPGMRMVPSGRLT